MATSKRSSAVLYLQAVLLAKEITRQIVKREKVRGDLWDDHSQKMLRIGARAWNRCDRRKKQAHHDTQKAE